MRYAFIAEHRPQFSVRAMCRCLRIHPSGFYAWLKNPLSKRAKEDARQTEIIRKAWKESGKVYGYRKLPAQAQACQERDGVNRRVRTAAKNDNRGRLENAGLFSRLTPASGHKPIFKSLYRSPAGLACQASARTSRFWFFLIERRLTPGGALPDLNMPSTSSQRS